MDFDTCIKAIKDNVDSYLNDGDVSHLQANESIWARIIEMGKLEEADKIFQQEALGDMLAAGHRH